MIESGVIDADDLTKSKVALVYGQMNEPPGARMRVALSGLTMAEAVPRPVWYRRSVLRGQHLPLYTSGLRGFRALGPYPFRCGLPANTGDRHGPDAGTHYVDKERLDHIRSGDLRACR